MNSGQGHVDVAAAASAAVMIADRFESSGSADTTSATTISCAATTATSPTNFTAAIWSSNAFQTPPPPRLRSSNLTLDLPKSTWTVMSGTLDTETNADDDEDDAVQHADVYVAGAESDRVDEGIGEDTSGNDLLSPSHHARRPMNAFLIFCKKHRQIVRNQLKMIENRAVTKILGEWWALLDEQEKWPYTSLAKTYKDAFFTANPNFKWYKLPAPPLRTLATTQRLATTPTTYHNDVDTNISTSPPPISSPTTTEFITPGKLADESKLGKLSSLCNLTKTFTAITPSTSSSSSNDFHNNNNCVIENNNYNGDTDELHNYKLEEEFQSPPDAVIENSTPLRPFKKRSFHDTTELNRVSRALFEDADAADLRKSDRKCKGKRYEAFMSIGKTKSRGRDGSKHDGSFDSSCHQLAQAWKRNSSDHEDDNDDDAANTTSTSHASKMSDFDLTRKLAELPCLSYESFLARKHDNKKRKFGRRRDRPSKQVFNAEQGYKRRAAVEDESRSMVVGSKKRKNKRSITHLEKPTTSASQVDEQQQVDADQNEFLGLETLAEIATRLQENIAAAV